MQASSQKNVYGTCYNSYSPLQFPIFFRKVKIIGNGALGRYILYEKEVRNKMWDTFILLIKMYWKYK